jgi:MoxR-like ATPase
MDMVEQQATWRVFTGDGQARPRRPIPDPPPWRVFPARGADPERYVYRPYPRLVNAINLAICLRRPLLLTGQAGIGKSSVADAIAHELVLGEVLRWNITSRSTLEEGLYRYDALGRLQHQQRTNEDVIEKFLRLGPLGTALASPERRVLLIDELDKSDIDLPGDLLNGLERGEFEIPELARRDGDGLNIRASDSDTTFRVDKGKVSGTVFPIIVITSNGEREFSPAFLRRCIRERMEIPDSDRLADIVKAHLGPKLAAKADRLINDFAKRIGSVDRPTALAIDQLLNTVLMLTREDIPTDESTRNELIELLQRELRET